MPASVYTAIVPEIKIEQQDRRITELCGEDIIVSQQIKIEQLTKEITELKIENKDLQATVDEVDNENNELLDDAQALKQQVTELLEANALLKSENEKVHDRCEGLFNRVGEVAVARAMASY
jgi:regulator of replication initiation timing